MSEQQEYEATTEMFDALEKLCEAVKLYFESGDEKREDALHELYFGREHGEAALKVWEENDAE